MSEARLIKLLGIEEFVQDASNCDIINSIIYLISEIDKMRQKLEAEEAKISDLKLAVKESDADIEAYKKAIREAWEQKPIKFALENSEFGIGTTMFDSYEEAINFGAHVTGDNFPVSLFLFPVPAMPAQHDKLQALRIEVAESIKILAMCGDKTPFDQLGKKMCDALNASAPQSEVKPS